MSGASPHLLRNPEVVAYLWVYADEAGDVSRVAGKAYVLDGSDRQKLDVLRRPAITDFLSTEWMPITESFGVVGPDGERLRCAQLSVLSHEYSKLALVGPLLKNLASSVPKQLHEVNDEYRRFKLQIPELPLTVLTVVIEYSDVRLVRMRSN